MRASNGNENASATPLSVGSACNTECDTVECTMAIIPVKVRLADGSRIIETYAFLDPGSNVTFARKDCDVY